MKIDWKRKLTSRKLWLAVIGFVTALMMAKGAAPDTIERVTGVIMSGATVIAYILAEGYIDGQREGSDIMYVEQMPGEPGEYPDVDQEFE